MGNPDTNTRASNVTRTRNRRGSPLRPHTFGTWQAVRSFYDRQPQKQKRYPKLDEIVAERAALGQPAISRQAVYQHLALLQEAGKIVRSNPPRSEITWAAPYDADKATAEVEKTAAEKSA